MTTVRDEETPPSLSDIGTRSVRVTTDHVVRAVVALQVLVLAVVAVERLGLDLPVVREIVAVVYLTLVPGYLLLRIADIDPGRVETVLFSVGLSLVSLMAVGVVANFLLRALGVARPISELPMVLAIAVFVGGLTAVYAVRVDDTRWIEVDTRRLTSPSVLAFALLPVAGVYGALILTRFGNNYLLIVLYAVLLAIPALAALGKIPRELFPYALWTVALTLLLQNSLSGHYMAWGDSPKEARLALAVLADGYWEPAAAPAFGSKFTMLRIVILHPIYALFTDLRFVWEFKVVHPLIFSLTPVALYRAYQRYTAPTTAFLSALLYVSLFSFFVVLSRNTRTATALFFIALFVLLIANERLAPDRKKLLAIVFVAGIVVSHYGVSYMIMAAMALAIPAERVLGRLRPTIATTDRLTSPVFGLLYGTMLFAWYIYASPGSKAFNLLIGFGQSFTDRLADQFLANPDSTSASTRYLTSNFTSTTLDALKLYNVLVGAVIVVGLGLTYWRVFRNEDIEFDSEYLAYASVALAVFGITFLPVERFNTARTYPTTLLFFAPFFVVGIREVIRRLRTSTPAVTRTGAHRIAAVALVLFLALNIGFVSAAITNEYSTNALVEKDRIMDNGHPTEKNYFYKQYPTVYGVQSTDWMHAAGLNNSTVFLSGWPGGMKGAVGHRTLSGATEDRPYFRGQSIQREMLANESQLDGGYVYLSAFSHEGLGDVIRLPSGHFAFEYTRTHEAKEHWENKSLVYVNGGSSVYYGS